MNVEPLEQEAPAIRKEVTYYSWHEDQPSSVMIRISGGERMRDGNGRTTSIAEVTRRFDRGILHVNEKDSDVIAELNKLMADPGSCITTDYEVYLKNVLDPKRAALRAQAQLKVAQEENNRLKAELTSRKSTKA